VDLSKAHERLGAELDVDALCSGLLKGLAGPGFDRAVRSLRSPGRESFSIGWPIFVREDGVGGFEAIPVFVAAMTFSLGAEEEVQFNLDTDLAVQPYCFATTSALRLPSSAGPNRISHRRSMLQTSAHQKSACQT
jgi:hypothetical protein